MSDKISPWQFNDIYKSFEDIKKVADVAGSCCGELETPPELAVNGASWLIGARCDVALDTLNWVLESHINSLLDSDEDKDTFIKLLKQKQGEDEDE